MTTLDASLAHLRTAASRALAVGQRVYDAWDRFGSFIKSLMPTGLYARSLLIIIAPMVLLQSVVAFVFMERHWNTVTRRLSAAVTQDIAALIELSKLYPQRRRQRTNIRRIAAASGSACRSISCPSPTCRRPARSRSSRCSTRRCRTRSAGRSAGRSGSTPSAARRWSRSASSSTTRCMRVFAPRNAAYASNSDIFLVWMVGTSLVLLTVAILFLRNQIRPILRLAEAAESFGKGRDVPNFRPRGAREVRRAASAFIEMKARVERAIDQRTTMLAGVSHDLRTVLTRFKLELALIGDAPEIEAMKRDVDEMARMLEAYLAFARGDGGEQAAPTDMAAFLEELQGRRRAARPQDRGGRSTAIPVVTVRPNAFKRCLANLVSNAARFADAIAITGHRDHRWLTVTIDDDGPGIPAHLREDVFKPFLRLDDARNQDEGGTGLGLAIARDIARSHGGDITLGESPLGGLRATVRVPV